jgi:hypothetical protein
VKFIEFIDDGVLGFIVREFETYLFVMMHLSDVADGFLDRVGY